MFVTSLTARYATATEKNKEHLAVKNHAIFYISNLPFVSPAVARFSDDTPAVARLSDDLPARSPDVVPLLERDGRGGFGNLVNLDF